MFFLIVKNVCSQSIEGIAVYSKSYIENTLEEETFISKRMKSMKSEFENLRFDLKFTKSESVFEVEEMIDFQEDLMSQLALSVGGSNGVFYINTDDKIILNQNESFGQEFIVKSLLDNIKWKLHNETRKIGDYVCYKATTTYVVKNNKGTFNHPVTVWYAPEIPVGFGPIGYGGLPGLIVELQVQNFNYFMTKITLNPKKKIEIKKPTKGKLVTEEEFNTIGAEAMGNFKNKISN